MRRGMTGERSRGRRERERGVLSALGMRGRVSGGVEAVDVSEVFGVGIGCMRNLIV